MESAFNMSMIVRTTILLSCLSVAIGIAIALITMYEANQIGNIAQYRAGTHNPYREFNLQINFYSFKCTGLEALPKYLDKKFGLVLGYYLSLYIRYLIVSTVVYFIITGLWHVSIYHVFRHELFTKKSRQMPTAEIIFEQAMFSLLNCVVVVPMVPIIIEYLIDNGYTKMYYYLDEIGGWKCYVWYLFVFVAFVEFGVYWIHRGLHENKFLFKYLHAVHHKYNKSTTLSPWSSASFNPIDSFLIATPNIIVLLFVPMHFLTNSFLQFISLIWAINIHDALPMDSEPLMGSKYHTIHHTHYHYNYSQFFIFWDYVFGTLRAPEKKID